MERFLNIKELSQLLNVKAGTIYEWVHKQIPVSSSRGVRSMTNDLFMYLPLFLSHF
jgi:predicted DNA-binding transcriptional regulator AlpA